MRRVALALAALALAGCETTQEKSAKLEKVAKREARETARRKALARRPLSVTRQSRLVRVTATAVLHSPEGTVAVVTLHNSSATSLRAVPVEITVLDARGRSVYTNAASGLAPSLTSLALAPAHATRTWIDDQVQASGTPARVSAKVGEGDAFNGAIPQLAVAGARLSEGEVEGSVVNRSRESLREVVVFALARRAGRIVAAGRAVVPVAEAGSSTHFQAFLIGDARGARLEVSADGVA